MNKQLAPSNMKTPRNHLLAHTIACTLALYSAVAPASGGQVTATGNAEANWSTNDLTILTPGFHINSDGLIGGSLSFSLFYELDDRSIQGVRPYGSTIGISIAMASDYLRSGATVDSSLSYQTSLDYLKSDAFQNSAVAGTNNYLGLAYSDGSGNTYYGWQQFDLEHFQNGGLGVNFITGFINDVPGGAIITSQSPVPEPTTLALALTGLSGLVLLRKRK